jgi:hypothetical protein
MRIIAHEPTQPTQTSHTHAKACHACGISHLAVGAAHQACHALHVLHSAHAHAPLLLLRLCRPVVHIAHGLTHHLLLLKPQHLRSKQLLVVV